MAPCFRAALRLLTSIILTSTASAAALPAPSSPQILNSNTNLRISRNAETNLPVTLNSKPDPKNFFNDLKDFISQYDVGDIVRSFLTGFLGPARPPRPTRPQITVTTNLAPTPVEKTSEVVTIFITPSPVGGAPSSYPTSTSAMASTLAFTSAPDFEALPFPSPLPSIEIPEQSSTVVITASASIPIASNSSTYASPAVSPTSSLPEFHILPFPFPLSGSITKVVWPTGAGTGGGISGTNSGSRNTTTLKRTSTVFVTKTISPILATAGGTGGGMIPPAMIATPRWTNTTSTSLAVATPTAPTSIATSISFTPLIPLPAPIINTTSTFAYNALSPLRKICQNPTIKTITLPLLSSFYGPNAYPSLHPFPGCVPPTINSSQSIRAPGLLNCTLLGQSVQFCQSLGRKVLLSVRASSGGEVGGNLEYGSPSSVPQPFGPYFGSIGPGGINEAVVSNKHQNLFDEYHPPTALALTLFSLFGEGHTERADLRPLGPLTPKNPSAAPDGIKWWSKPLGEEVVIDGFDVQVPSEWKGTYQSGQFDAFVKRLRELVDESWKDAGAEKGGKGDLGADGKGVVVQGWA